MSAPNCFDQQPLGCGFDLPPRRIDYAQRSKKTIQHVDSTHLRDATTFPISLRTSTKARVRSRSIMMGMP